MALLIHQHYVQEKGSGNRVSWSKCRQVNTQQSCKGAEHKDCVLMCSRPFKLLKARSEITSNMA